MSRKVFITVLGASFYGKCYYKTETFRSSLTPFIQCATLELIGAKEWDADSAGYVLLTEKAKTDNWDRNLVERKRNPTGPMLPYVGLEKVLEDMHLPFDVKPIPIPNGDNEQEIWQIFESLYSLLQEGDELYFDLTHGFRYLPMLVLVFGNYAKLVSKCKVMHISYGNFEGGKPVEGEPEVKECDFVNLLPFSGLQDWTDAVELFNYTGNTRKIRNIIDNTLSTIKGPDPKKQEMKSIHKPLEELSQDLLTCQGKSLIEGKVLAKLFGQLDQIKLQYLPKPFLPLVDKIRKDFAGFTTAYSWRNGIAAARWCFDRQQYQQAITFLQESVNTYLCIVLGLDWNNIEHREFASGAIIHWCNALLTKAKGDCQKAKQMVEEGWRMDPEVELYVRFMVSHESLMKLVDYYQSISQPRNGYNHCHMLQDLDGNSVIDTIEKRLLDIEVNWKQEDSLQPLCKPLFVNISNHPSDGWSKKQLLAARAYGEIIDIEFPDVSPVIKSKDFDKLKRQVVDKLKVVAPMALSTTVHVMGEMTLTYALVNELKRMGYTCVASTSQRVAVENADGSKTSTFQFEKFRQYM